MTEFCSCFYCGSWRGVVPPQAYDQISFANVVVFPLSTDLPPVNVSKTATGPVLTVTSAVDDKPWTGIAVITALPAPAPVTLAVLPLKGATVTAVAFDVVHEKLMSGITTCALSYAVAVNVTDLKSGTVMGVGVTTTLAAVGTKLPSTSKFEYVDCQL